MPFTVTEELRSTNLDVTLNSIEEAKDFLVYDGISIEENIEIMDNYGDPFWVANRESLLNTITNIDFNWDQNTQTLTRTLVFSSESAYVNYRKMINVVFPAIERELSVLNTNVI